MIYYYKEHMEDHSLDWDRGIEFHIFPKWKGSDCFRLRWNICCEKSRLNLDSKHDKAIQSVIDTDL